jgi:hypothetical protein
MTDATPTDLLTPLSVMSFWLTLEAPATGEFVTVKAPKSHKDQ